MCEYIDNIKTITQEFGGAEAIAKIIDETAKEQIMDLMDDPSLGIPLKELGVTLEDLNNNEYMHFVSDKEVLVDDSENFAKKDLVNLYRYVAHTSSGYGSSNIGENTRRFCKKVSNRTNSALMRYVDILKLNGSNAGFGQGGSNVYSVFKFRGGVNCKHIWVKYVFNTKTKKLVKAPPSEQPKQIGAGDVPNA